MEKIIVHSNSTSEWQDLVIDAANNCSIRINEELESYLVFLLMRFTKDVTLAKKIVALDFLEAQHQSKNQRQQALRDIGDTCLLFSGFFPEISIKRRVSPSYYVKIGKSAYQILGVDLDRSLADLFKNLSNSFVKLMDILQTMRKFNSHNNINLLVSEELWRDFGSASSLLTLKQYSSSSSIFTRESSNSPTTRH